MIPTAFTTYVPAALLGGTLGAFGFVVFLTTFLLVLGWTTRSRSVLWLAIVFSLVPGLAAGAACVVEAGRVEVGQLRGAFLAVLRVLGFCWFLVTVVAVYRLRLTAPLPRRQRPEASGQTYDRDWLLSLLQSKVGGGTEGVAIISPSGPAADRSPPADHFSKPYG